MQGPTGPAGLPPKEPPRTDAGDADFRRHDRGDRFDTAERHAGRQMAGQDGRAAPGADASLIARAADFADRVAARGGSGAQAHTPAEGRRLLAERAPRQEAEGAGRETPRRETGADGRSAGGFTGDADGRTQSPAGGLGDGSAEAGARGALPGDPGAAAEGSVPEGLMPLPGAIPLSALFAPATPSALAGSPPPLAADLAARIDRLAETLGGRIEALSVGPSGSGGVAISLPLDPAVDGLAGVQVIQHGTGAAARIEVVLTGAAPAIAAQLAQAAQQLADRLQARFPLRPIAILAEDGAAPPQQSGQAALSALFARPPTGDDG